MAVKTSGAFVHTLFHILSFVSYSFYTIVALFFNGKNAPETAGFGNVYDL